MYTVYASGSPQRSQQPDFAFPQKVEKSAAADLQRAMRSDDGRGAVQAMIQLGLAKSIVNSDSLPSVLGQIAALTGREKDPVAKAVLRTLSATIYCNLYESDQWKINRRVTLASAGEDYNLWSRQQFLDRVASLTRESLSDADALAATPVGDWKGVVDVSRDCLMFYPTMLDFVASQGIAHLQVFSEDLNVLNPRLISQPTDSALYPRGCEPLGEILDIYRLLLIRHADASAPLFMNDAEMRAFIARNTFGSDFATAQRRLRAEMLSLYQAHRADVYSGIYLLNATDGSDSGAGSEQNVAFLREFAANHPDFYNIAMVRNRIAMLTNPQASVSLPSAVAPGVPFKVEVKSVNCRTVKVDFYYLPSLTPTDDRGITLDRLPAVLHSETLTFRDSVPFCSSQKFDVTFDRPGMYTYRVTADGVAQRRHYDLLNCSRLALGVININGDQSAWVNDPVTGEPVAGAAVWFRPWSRTKTFAQLPGLTSAAGTLAVKSDGNGILSARKGEDLYAPVMNIYTGGSYNPSTALMAQIYTSLRLYRPGDEVRFALVAYEQGPERRALADSRQFRVVMRDANYQAVDTAVVTTDSWGRAEGAFTLPSSGLTGMFSLQAVADGTRQRIAGQCDFQVSDYKLPTFTVETTEVSRPTSAVSGAAIDGKAMTYSGFPVADAKVKASLLVQIGHWWRARQSPVFYTAETVTDLSGNFHIDIPAEAIASAPAPDGMFTCNIQVTSADGETHESDATFNMGKPLVLVADIPSVVNLGKVIKATVTAADVNGRRQTVDLIYKVRKDSATVISGRMESGSVAQLVGALAPGVYTFEFTPADTVLAMPVKAENVILYGGKGTVCPVDKPLWVPVNAVEADRDGEAHIPFGSSVKGAYVRLIAAACPGRVIEQTWIRTDAGMQSVALKLPKGVDKASVELSCIRNFRSYNYRVVITRSGSHKAISVGITTFRDHVTPGEREKITLKVTPEGETGTQSALMLAMANLAIDQLQSNPMVMPEFRAAMARLNVSAPDFGTSSNSVSHSYKQLPVPDVSRPDFNFYGQSFMPVIMYEMAMPMMKANSRALSTMAVESASEEKDEAVMEDSADAGAAIGGSAENEGGSDVAEETPVYRPSEIPLAFFRPMLTTQPDGSIEIAYDVPDANTTWILRALAYNQELLADTAQAFVVSSKPVIVSLNAPRFVRGGDTLTLAASVMNNSGVAQRVGVLSEVVSSGSGKVLFAKENTVELDSMASAVVQLPVDVSGAETGLIYRVRATAGNFSDGEQSLMPVLPSTQDVTESEIFYIAPDRQQFSMELPALGDNDRAYLNFTENPSWMVVSALPGLRDNKINSSVEAAAALFSACVAQGIMRDNPEIARVVRQWVDNPSDSALVSGLQKNQELKSMLLSATPWVSEALSDTQRMQRLALIFDHRQVQGVIGQALDILAKTRADGGWAWTAVYPSVSEWATYVVLEQLGDLNAMGWLPSDRRLASWIRETCEYLDRETSARFRKYPESDYWHYVIIRDKFPDVKLSTAASRVVEAQVQKCLAKWRDAGVSLRAVYALILNSHGYNASARQLIASLTELATRTPEKGMWWQQLDRSSLWSYDRIGQTSVILDAFHAVEPASDCVDAIRQWLILNKTNNDWGSAVITSQVITSILTTGKPLKVNTRGTAIHVGTRLVQPDRQEYATGAFTQNITPMLQRPATLTIDRQADYPSVGGVVTMRTLPMADVKAAGCAEASVSKSLCVFRDGQWVPSDSYNVGDKVRVELILKIEDDLSYVVIEDLRAAGLEPVEQLPEPVWADGLCFYRENRDSQTNIFIDRLPRGTYRVAYELFASQAGRFSSGAAQLRSQYNPIVAAHSSASPLNIK